MLANDGQGMSRPLPDSWYHDLVSLQKVTDLPGAVAKDQRVAWYYPGHDKAHGSKMHDKKKKGQPYLLTTEQESDRFLIT